MGKALYLREKFQHVLFWIVTSVIGTVVALNYGLPFEVIAAYWIGSGVAIGGAMVAYGLSDAAHAKR